MTGQNSKMVRIMSHVDRQYLQRLLEDTLPEATERDVAEHLAACANCQQALESLAAGKGWWDEAARRLSHSSFALSPQGSGVNDDWPGPSQDCLTDQFVSDFAVDFLEPCEDSKQLGRLGDYEILAVIGHGGMGVVLKGYQAELNRFVAVKVLAPHLATSGAARRRFAREAQATAAIVHPHVMAIHSVHANVKLPYLVMPFVDCESLQQRLDRNGPLDVKDILRIGMQTAAGLAAAHAQGLVHRDIKPANILLETTVDRVMLTDFGLARAVDDATLTRTGVIAGTPQYMSPEQANGDPMDHRSDLFSLGGVLYAMCTGRPPFRAETTFGTLRKIREASPRAIREINPDIPAWLETFVMRLLAKASGDRIESAERVALLLERCLAHVQQPTTTGLPAEIESWSAGSEPATHRRNRKTRSGWLPAALKVAALMAIIGLAVRWPAREPMAIDPNVQVIALPTTPVVDTPDQLLQWNGLQPEIERTRRALNSLEMSIMSTDKPTGVLIQQPHESQRQEQP